MQLLTIKDIMKMLGVGRATAERYARECGLALPRVKNGPYLARRTAFEAYMEGATK